MNSNLMFVYTLLLDEQEKLTAKIKRVDTTIRTADEMDKEYWKNVRSDFVSQLNNLYRAIGILFKELIDNAE